MAEINDGGPAFPVQDAASWQAHGMSMRDYFAAHASDADIDFFVPKTIGATIETLIELGRIKRPGVGVDYTRAYTPSQVRDLRQWARYQHADAMLKARAA
jgi:hypothetical protein